MKMDGILPSSLNPLATQNPVVTLLVDGLATKAR
jgi:hypothetical protein